MEKISRGPTFSGKHSYAGLALILLSIYLFFGPLTSVIAGAVLIIPGLLLFLSIRGTLIDFKHELIKPYQDFLFFKFGDWSELSAYDKIILKPESSVDIRNPKDQPSVYFSDKNLTFSFEIILKGERVEKIILKDLSDYRKGKKFLNEYALKLKKEPVDYYEMAKEIIEKKRRERGI
ncbi:MAG: hypothetical protein V2A54_09575 [Bacteroidota bacterium]